MINKVTLVGYVGRDAEIRYLQSGQAVANFSMATSEKWKDRDGEQQERTEWHRIQSWGKLAEIVGKYVTKGRLLYVEGRLQTREWEDKNGEKRRTTEVVAQVVKLLGKSDGGSREEEREQQDERYQGPPPEPVNEDIPF